MTSLQARLARAEELTQPSDQTRRPDYTPARELPRGGMSGREVEVLILISDGYTNPEIAGKLFLAPETIKSHVKHILARTGSRTRAHAVANALRKGWIE